MFSQDRVEASGWLGPTDRGPYRLRRHRIVGSGRSDIRHETAEFLAQPRAFCGKALGRIQHLLRGGPGFGGAAIDLHDAGGGLVGALRDVLDAARDLLGRRALLLDRGGNRRRDVRYLGDGAPDLLDRRHGFLGRTLHAGNMGRYLVGGDDRETAAGLTGAGGFDGGVQRQQVGLLGDRGDQLDDVADLLRGARQFADAAIGLPRLGSRRFRDLAGFLTPPADFVDRRGKLAGRVRDRLHVAGGLFRCAGDLAGEAVGGSRRSQEGAGGG